MNQVIEKIRNHLLGEIKEGNYTVNQRIPSASELAKEFNTTRMNGYFAVKDLENKGIVKQVKGKGTFVRKKVSSTEVMNLTNSTKNIHILYSLHSSNIMYWGETMLHAIEMAVGDKGYSLISKGIPGNITEQLFRRTLNEIENEGSVALIILPDNVEKLFLLKHADIIAAFSSPVYLLNRDGNIMPGFPGHLISVDHYAGGVMAGKLLKNNRQSVVFFGEENFRPSFWGQQRYHGVQFGLNCGAKDSFKLSWETNKDKLVKKIAKASPQKTVIVAVNDMVAASLIDYTREKSLIPPWDYEIISFDNDPEFRSYNLTTIAPSLEKIGKLFGKLICNNQFPIDDGDFIDIKIALKIFARQTFRNNSI